MEEGNCSEKFSPKYEAPSGAIEKDPALCVGMWGSQDCSVLCGSRSCPTRRLGAVKAAVTELG